ncbi:MAG: glycosyltransferase [Verrucomicrobia bacterium]|nr:glycosyltransferase [Verrucomicrobiota bacterium]
MIFPRKLLVVTRVDHYLHQGRYYAYTPYAREIDVWAELFGDVTVAGTLRRGVPPADCSLFAQRNVRVVPVEEAGGDGLKAKFLQLFALPGILFQVAKYMRGADAIHTRCPCDLGLVTLLLGPLFSRKLIAKYATQWLPYAGEPSAWRFQRFLLRSKWWNSPVTVYGRWPDQPANVVPFFTSMLTEEQIGQARSAAVRPRDPDVYRILFVGRLSASKNVDVLLRAVATLNVPNRAVECVVVGEGPEEEKLRNLAAELRVGHQVKFLGGLSFNDVLSQYEEADVLVLASNIEGWPKAVAEGMAFGCVCIGTERGMMPQMLGEGRGFLVPPRDPVALGKALQQIADQPEEARAMARCAAEWAQRYSLEGLREALRQVMIEHWQLKTRIPSPSGRGAP